MKNHKTLSKYTWSNKKSMEVGICNTKALKLPKSQSMYISYPDGDTWYLSKDEMLVTTMLIIQSLIKN
jgi:hypothetical protein